MKKNRLIAALGASAFLALAACQSRTQVFRAPAPAQRLNTFNTGSAQAQVVEIQWQNQAQIVEAATAGLDLFGANPARRTARARVDAEQVELLKRIGLTVQPTIEANMESSRLPSGYMTYADLTRKLQALEQAYPRLVTLEDVGDTYLKKTGKAPNNDIWAISITNKRALGSKPALMLVAGMHARELAPVELVMKLAEELTAGYGKDPEITKLMDTREVVLLPMVNVDGRIEVEKGDNWQRKNLNTSRGSGVDLNRNFDSHWNYEGLNPPSSWLRGLKNPNSQTYSGTAPASEPETQTVQNMYRRKPNITMAMDIHAYGEMFFWPLGFQKAPIPEVPQYRNVWESTFKKLGYTGGTSLELLYPTSGTTDDYGYEKHGAFSMGLEVGHSFRPSYREVEQMWKETRSSWLGLIHFSGVVKKAK